MMMMNRHILQLHSLSVKPCTVCLPDTIKHTFVFCSKGDEPPCKLHKVGLTFMGVVVIQIRLLVSAF